MSLIGYIRSFFAWIWGNKFPILMSFVAAIVFSVLIFPYDDLSDLISAQVSLQTRNQIYLQFDRLRLSLFPQVGAQMDKVYVEAANFPGLSAQSITITPSISAMFSQKPYGRISARDILHGDVDLRVSHAGNSEKGTELTGLDIQAQHVSLQDIRQLAKLPILLKGQLDFKTAGQLDLAFQEQPDLDISLKISKFELPPGNVPTPMGDVSVPELKLSDVELKGKLNQGRFLIESAKLGNTGDDIQGTIKGSINIVMQAGPQGPQPMLGAYSLDIDLLPSPAFKTRAAFILEILSGYKSGDHIHFKASGTSFMAPPTMTPIR